MAVRVRWRSSRLRKRHEASSCERNGAQIFRTELSLCFHWTEALLAKAGFEVEIAHAALGAAPPKSERVFVLAESEDQACTLVRTALRLSDEPITIVRILPEGEWKNMGLKPFQVGHTPHKIAPIDETIRQARKRADET